jgi:hypothetical protein
MQARRILSIDILRGLGIMVIIVIHRIHYTWTGMRNSDVLHSQFSGPWAPLLIFTIVLFTMAGIFYFISGLVNAHAMYFRVISGKSTVLKAMAGGVAGGLWIFLMNYVQRIFFMNGFLSAEPDADPGFPVGLLTGWVRNPAEVSFSWTQVTDPGTLSLIGLVVVFVSLALGLMLKYPGIFSKKRIIMTLMILSLIALLVSPFSKFYLRPVYSQWFEAGNYFLAGCIGQVCQEFGLLPYLGYGFIGVIFGIGIASGESLSRLKSRSYFFSLILIIMGAALILIFERGDPFGKDCIGSGICMIELGIFILLQLWLYKFIDQQDAAATARRKRQSVAVRRFGMLALTVYILEPLVAEVFRKIASLIFGTGWNDQLQYVLLFGGILLIFWWRVLKLWERAGFAGSFEWLTGLVLLKLSGKRSGKVSFKSLE